MKKINNKIIYVFVLILGILIGENIFCTCKTVYESFGINVSQEDSTTKKTGKHLVNALGSALSGNPGSAVKSVKNATNAVARQVVHDTTKDE